MVDADDVGAGVPERLGEFTFLSGGHNDFHGIRVALDVRTAFSEIDAKFVAQLIGDDFDAVAGAEQFVSGSGADQAATVNDDYAIADLFDFRENVRAEEDRFAGGFEG